MTSPSLPERTEPLTLPHLLAGRYELRRLVGSGGMGDVYGAVDVLLHRDVAVKILRRSEETGSIDVTRFHAEACALASLASPFVVAIHDFGFAPEGLFTVMRHVAGRALDTMLAEGGALSARRALRITSQVLAGLIELHGHGFVHGDVKPGNVIVDAGDRAVLIDLGVAANLRAGGRVGGGTPPYMAPEAVHGSARVDPRADLHAAGILLIEALTGAQVSDREDGTHRAGALPAPLASVARTAIDPDRERRFRDARAMRDAVRAAARGLRTLGIDPDAPIVAGPTGPMPNRVTIASRPSKPRA